MLSAKIPPDGKYGEMPAFKTLPSRRILFCVMVLWKLGRDVSPTDSLRAGYCWETSIVSHRHLNTRECLAV